MARKDNLNFRRGAGVTDESAFTEPAFQNGKFKHNSHSSATSPQLMGAIGSWTHFKKRHGLHRFH
jgi:hypothetical protein